MAFCGKKVVDIPTPSMAVVQIFDSNAVAVPVLNKDAVRASEPAEHARLIQHLVKIFPTNTAYAFRPWKVTTVKPYTFVIGIGTEVEQAV